MDKTTILVQTNINAPIDIVWKCWTSPEHITKWNFASDDWHCPHAENDLKVGGKFFWRMEAKDASFGFDFEGTYQTVRSCQLIEYSIIDGRKVRIEFTKSRSMTKVTELFEAESVNLVELQRGGWQAILNNFKNYAESTNR